MVIRPLPHRHRQRTTSPLDRNRSTWLMICCGIALWTNSAHAQQRFAVQQPVVGRFGVNTTVSVPDRGSAHLGSVSRSGSSQSTYGPTPFRVGSNRGSFVEHSSIRTHVQIHDMAEMDRQVLAAAETRPSCNNFPRPPPPTPAELASIQLSERVTATASRLSQRRPSSSSPPTALYTVLPPARPLHNRSTR